MAIAEFTEPNVVDHRDAAIAALKPIASKLDEIYSGANSFDDEAWDLFGSASTKATKTIEAFEEEPCHSGSLHTALRGILALMRGAQLILEAKGDDRNIEEEGAFSLMQRHVPSMKSHVEALGQQSYLECGGRAVPVEVQHG